MVSTETTDKPLSAKHNEFLNKLFILKFNATKAYSETYPDNKTPEYSSSRLLSNVKIQAEIERRQAKTAVKYELKAEKVISRLSKIGGLMPATFDDNILSTTSADQIRSLDLLGKHLRLWDRTGEIDGDERVVLDARHALQVKLIAEQLVANSNKPKCIESKEIKNE